MVIADQDAAAAGELEFAEPLLDEPEPVDVEVLDPDSVDDPLLFEPSDEGVELDDVSAAATVLPPPLRLSVR